MNKRGLTIIEVVLVVVIIGILATISVPSVSGLLNNVNRSSDNAKAGLYENALRAYVFQKAQVKEFVNISKTHGSQSLVANSIANVLGESIAFETKTKEWAFYYHPRSLSVVAMEYDGLEKNEMIALVKNMEGLWEEGDPKGELLEAAP